MMPGWFLALAAGGLVAGLLFGPKHPRLWLGVMLVAGVAALTAAVGVLEVSRLRDAGVLGECRLARGRHVDVAAQRLRAEHLAALGELLRDDAVEPTDLREIGVGRAQEGIAEPPGPPGARLGEGANPDRRVGRLERLDVRPHTVEVPVPPVMRDLILGPQAREEPEDLVEPRRALTDRDVEVRELLGTVAEADSQAEPPAAHDVEGGDLLSEQDGVVQRADHDVRRQAHVRPRVRGEAREQRDRLEPAQVAVEEVLADREVGAPLLLGHLDDAEHVPVLLVGRKRARHVTEQDPDRDHGRLPPDGMMTMRIMVLAVRDALWLSAIARVGAR